MRDEKTRRYDAVIFDLDGTLLDTLADLADSANATLAHYGLPQFSREEICGFVGNGARNLIRQIVPGGEADPNYHRVLDSFRAYYGEHCMDATKAYPGIMPLLEWLKQENYRTAIVSNKPDFAVKKLNQVYFDGLIEVAVGEREGIRRKPAPDSVLLALEELGISRERAVYVGDSDVDLRTAEQAGMDCIAVSWGFRDRAFLLEQGADPERIADDAEELRTMLETA